MRITTKPFGEIEIAEESIIEVKEGIIGFPRLTRYVILNSEGGGPFKWFQSVDRADLAFVVISPYEFRPDYTLDVNKSDLDSIGLADPSKAVILSIVVIPDDPSLMTANLQGPLVINPRTKQSKQMISNNPQYSVRHYIIQEMQAWADSDKGEERGGNKLC
ncbi:MAG: flagellar assembly protein FliW [bacterium]